MTMRLFLVRHGETVDNVAGIYAGTHDSPLTAHGVLQARRLGAHLASRSATIGPVRHVFASDLKRAVETAAAVVDAQTAAVGGNQPRSQPATSDSDSDPFRVDSGEKDADSNKAADPAASLKLVELPELRERDFGSAEGEKFGVDLALAGAESWEQMRQRAASFVDTHLVPLLTAEQVALGGCIVVVAHGLILGSLLRVLLARYGSGQLARLAGGKMPGWSNTGYYELIVDAVSSSPVVASRSGLASSGSSAGVSGERTPKLTLPTPSPQGPHITLSVAGVNMLKHLEGLKKTRGGIGSAQFDKRQRTMDSFFAPAAKKAKVEPAPEVA
ncbi:histidine phosphatase superfamily [Thermothelomyces heterothallicus CBS 202.75]|uniref:histidine phosphatase superfamily n=1 Tax=Thermothelomyces heterothallicus CBS 202.75 TaxID=1149848 RepID=UPI003742D800